MPDVVIQRHRTRRRHRSEFGHRRPGEQERGDIRVQRPAGLDVAVVLDIDCVAEQGPPVAVVLNAVPGVEEVFQPRQVFCSAAR